MAAVGSYGTGIEIWDLDVIDSVEPAAVLGGPVAGADTPAQPKSKTKKKPGRKVICHQCPALVLSSACASLSGLYCTYGALLPCCPRWKVAKLST